MNLMVASDLHGSAYYTAQLVKAFHWEEPDQLLLLGDLLYHGPRNDLPQDYAPKKVIEMLNALGRKIFCVRGNCDSEVDQMVLDFPIMADYCLLFDRGLRIYATHGHRISEILPMKLQCGDILLSGHTHVPMCEINESGDIRCNPGSVSLPKEGSWHGYLMIKDGEFVWKDLSGNVKMRHLFCTER